MHECANCGYTNRAGVVFCDNCGASLIGKLPISTKALDTGSDAQVGANGGELGAVKGGLTQGMATFVMGDRLKLDIEGAVKSVVLQPKTETILGRRDPATGVAPDVDLTPFAGYRMGVSRRHAAVRYGDDNTLNVWDLGSSNGTFLNGQRLNAHRPYRLHDGDELRLGQMVIRLYFRSGKIAPSLGEASALSPERATPSQPAQGPKTATREKPVPQPEPLRAVLTPPPLAMAVAPLKPPGGEELPIASDAAQPGEVPAGSAQEAKAVPEPAEATSAPEAALPAAAEAPAEQPASPLAAPLSAPVASPAEKMPPDAPGTPLAPPDTLPKRPPVQPQTPPVPAAKAPPQEPPSPKPDSPQVAAADSLAAKPETPPSAVAGPDVPPAEQASEPPHSSAQEAGESWPGKDDIEP